MLLISLLFIAVDNASLLVIKNLIHFQTGGREERGRESEKKKRGSYFNTFI